MSHRKQYHISPGVGVVECNARKRPCPYQHFDTIEEARAELNRQAEAQRRAQEFSDEEFRARMTSLSDDEMMPIRVSLNNRLDNGRRIAERVTEIRARTGKKPMLNTGAITSAIGEGDNVYSFTALKRHYVTGSPARVATAWNIQVTDPRGNQVSSAKVNLDNSSDGRQLKSEVFSALNTAAERAYGQTPLAHNVRDRNVDAFVSVINSFETEERGAKTADALGFSFFRNSTRDDLYATADYSESSFRAEHIAEALESGIYDRTEPEVHVTVQDSMAKNSTSFWTLHTDDGQMWQVHVRRADGSTYSYPPSDDGQVLGSQVEEFAGTQMKMSPERVNASGAYVSELVTETAHVLDSHRQKVAVRQAEHEKWMQQATGGTSHLPKTSKVGQFFRRMLG